jgi:hypothetical protein
MIEELRKIESYIRKLEKENEQLRQNIQLLLSEEDVQGLASYPSLREVYGDNTTPAVKNPVKTTYVNNQFDSMYAPPGYRGKSKIESLTGSSPIPGDQKKIKPSVSITKKTVDNSTHQCPPDLESSRNTNKETTDVIDADLENALFNDITSIKAVVTPVTEKLKQVVNPVGDTVTAEFKGIKYIINNQKIYLASSGKRVGEINENIIIDGELLPLEKKKLKSVGDSYYVSDDEFAYSKFNSYVAYRVGEIKGEDLCVWS